MDDKSVKPFVTSMPVLGVAEDGSLVEMKFKMSDDTSATLRFRPEQMDTFIGTASQMFHDARSRKSITSGHLAIQPVPLAGAAARPVVGGGTVVLALRAANGVPYFFGLPERESAALREQMEAAEKSSREQAHQRRQ